MLLKKYKYNNKIKCKLKFVYCAALWDRLEGVTSIDVNPLIDSCLDKYFKVLLVFI